MFNYVLLGLLTCAHAESAVFGAAECNFDASVVDELLRVPGRMVIRFQAGNDLRSRLFIYARELASVMSNMDGVLIVDCRSKHVAVAFSAFRAGMDCSVREIDRLSDDIEAYDENDTFSVKVVHVARDISTRWVRERTCAVLPDWLAAFIFWAILTVVYCVAKFVLRYYQSFVFRRSKCTST